MADLIIKKTPLPSAAILGRNMTQREMFIWAPCAGMMIDQSLRESMMPMQQEGAAEIAISKDVDQFGISIYTDMAKGDAVKAEAAYKADKRFLREQIDLKQRAMGMDTTPG